MEEPGHGEGEVDDVEAIRLSLHDSRYFSIIFDRHVHTVSRFMARRARPVDVEDLVANTFVTAFRVRAKYDLNRPRVLPWLFGIATNVLNHHYRDEARRRRVFDRVRAQSPGGIAWVDGPADDATWAAAGTDRRLREALAQLSPGARDGLLLFACEGLTYEEVAEALGVPVGTVRSRIARSRIRLRELLGPLEAMEE